MKKLISVILAFTALVMVFANSCAYAYEFAPDTYSLDFLYVKENSGCTVSVDGIKLSAGGYITLFDELPFDCESVTVKASGADITLVLGEQSLSFDFSQSKEIAKSFSYPVHKDTKDIKITSNGGAEISDIIFTRKALGYPNNLGNAMPKISSEEYNTLCAVVMKTDSSIYFSQGAVRYADYSDYGNTVKLINGRMYAPAQAMAEALRVYSEIIPEKAYVFLRQDNGRELFVSSDISYRADENGKKICENPVLYIDAVPYLPIRYTAEFFGKTVLYKDGCAVIDTKKNANEIVSNESVWNYIADKINTPAKRAGKTYHVAQTKNASDSNDGSEKNPFLTLEKVGNTARAGDTVIIHEGVYRETLAPKNSGTKGNPITFKTADGENAVISALTEISGFSASDRENILYTDAPMLLAQGRNQIFYNGKPIGEGRHPNSDTKNSQIREKLNLSEMWPTFGDIAIRAYTSSEESTKPKLYELNSENDLNQPDGYWNGATYVGLSGSGWALSTAKVISSSWGSILTDGKNSSSVWWFGKRTDDDFGYLTNHINTVDKPCEWYADTENSKIYIYPPENEKAETLKLEYKTRQLAIDLREKSNIVIDGLHTIGGGITMHNGDMNIIDNCNMEYISHYTYSDDQRDGFIDNVNVRTADGAPARGEVGIYIDGDSCVVINSTINHSAGAGIYSAGSYALYENNYITDCGYMGSYTAGIMMQAPGWQKDKDYRHGGEYIYKNTIRRAGRACIAVESSIDNLNPLNVVLPFEISYNDVSDGLIKARDGGIIYEHFASTATDKRASKLHHNAVSSIWCGKSTPKSAIYHDNLLLGQNTYDNMIFEGTGEKMSPKIYTQGKNNFPTSYAVTHEWGNLAAQDKNSLSETDYFLYPSGKAYEIGSSVQNGKFTYNYENRANDTAFYPSYTDSDGYTVFENVNFGENKNVISLYLSADKYNPKNTTEVIIGADKASGIKTSADLNCNTSDMACVYRTDIPTGTRTGTQNVYIKPNNKDITLYRIQPYRDEAAKLVFKTLYTDTAELYGKITMGESVDGIHNFVRDTRRDSYMVYRNVTLQSGINEIVWSASSEGTAVGNAVSVYLDSMDNAPVATFDVGADQGWNTYVKGSKKINELPSGTHDVYIKFGGTSYMQTCNWYYMAFAAAD